MKSMMRMMFILTVAVIVAGNAGMALAAPASAPALDYSQQGLYTARPPFVAASAVPPLVMLVGGKDDRLVQKAYTDYSDLDDDGTADTTYKHNIIYYGYFDSFKCYTYSTASSRFEPAYFWDPAVQETSPSSDFMYCDTVAGDWSGNFLNWATMTRMDVIRKAMYGGFRSTDSGSDTVLQRAYIPPDGHAFVKMYEGDDLAKLTPYSKASYPSGISLCNVTRTAPNMSSNPPTWIPEIRIASGSWPYWTSLESAWGGQCAWDEDDADDPLDHKPSRATSSVISSNPYYLVVRVQAGVTSLLGRERVREYVSPSSHFKPIGLLQEYGEDSRMFFGHISGSYTKNKSGGVLRGKISDIGDSSSGQVNRSTGVFTGRTGVITALNDVNIHDFNHNALGVPYGGDCTSGSPAFSNGSCRDFGNPLAEQYYEALRYFRGLEEGRSEYAPTGGEPGSEDSWTHSDPYGAYGYEDCAKGYVLVLNELFSTYDSDDLPGSYFGTFSDDIGVNDVVNGALNVQEMANEVGDNEDLSGSYFIERVGPAGSDDGDCRPKTLSNGDDLGDIRGQCYEGAGKEGGYYLPGLSLYGRRNDLNPVSGTQNVTTFALAMPTGDPEVNITVNGHAMKLVPYCFNYRDNNPCTLLNFRIIEELPAVNPTEGRYYVNYENALRGADYDMDVEAEISYRIVGNQLYVKAEILSQSSGADERIGFILDGGPTSALDTTSFAASPAAGLYTQTAYDGTSRAIPSSVHSSLNKTNLWLLTSDRCSCDQVNDGFVQCDDAVDDEDDVQCPIRELQFDLSGTVTVAARKLENPLWYAAKYGAFDDYNENNRPDLDSEWDKDGNGVPNGYFYAKNALEMEQRLKDAFDEILNKTASGTAVSVLSTTGEGEGAVTQAFFYPQKRQEDAGGTTQVREWLGFLNSYFVDKWGNIREDTPQGGDTAGNAQLDSQAPNCTDSHQDRIVRFIFNEEDKVTRIRYFMDDGCDGVFDVDTNADGVNDEYTDTGLTSAMDEVHPLWQAGRQLWLRNAANRKIFTTLNGYDFTGLTENSTTGTFHDGNMTALKPYLDSGLPTSGTNLAAANTLASNLINFIRGVDNSAFRPRTITLDVDGDDESHVWKLGDIVNSTPMVVAKPAENMDLLYGNISYSYFRQKYAHRRQTVYVGANDGMLHAFNGGFFDATNHAFCKALDNDGNCDTNVTTPALGDELWAFIPRSLLPHLRWLSNKNYVHVYYVDLKPKVADVQIFTPEAACGANGYGSFSAGGCIHPGGWGTVLIGGMRFGGKQMAGYTASSGVANLYPEYFAIDITDPLNPRLLWSFSDLSLGITMSEVAIARTCSTSGGASCAVNCRPGTDTCGGKWFAIFGSGTSAAYVNSNTNVGFDSDSNLRNLQPGYVYAMNMSSGNATAGANNAKVSAWTLNTNYWKLKGNTSVATNQSFMSHPITVDVDLDFDVDAIFIGENCTDTGNTDTCSATNSAKNALMRRITTNKGTITSPASWTINPFVNIETMATTHETSRRITAAPSAAMDDKSNLWTYFGTGQFIGLADQTTAGTGSFLGVVDKCWDGPENHASDTTVCTNPYTTVFDRSNTVVCFGGEATCSLGGTTGVSLNSLVSQNCNTTTNRCDADASRTCTTNADCATDGWAMYYGDMTVESTDFSGDTMTHTGEMTIAKPLVIGGLVVWPTYIPSSNLCSIEGQSNVYAVYYKTGTAFKRFIYQAQKTLVGDDAGEDTVVARAKKLGVGMPSSISAQVTATGRAKGYAQSSTGAIIEIENNTPFSLKSNVIGWRSEEIP